MRRVSRPFSRASCWSPQFRSRWPRTPPACTLRPRRCARTTTRSRRGRRPRPSSSTRSRPSSDRREPRSRASPRDKRSSRATAPPRASSSRSRARRCSVSESRLADLVRALYEQSGRRDPLAILLGAASLDEALTGLDSLSRAAGENSRIIEQARASEKRLAALDARLAAREAELAQLAAAASARARTLAEAAETRKRFVASLRHAAGPQRGADRVDRSSGAERGGARTTAIAATAAPHDRRRRGGRARRGFGAARGERPDDHRQRHRLCPARAHRDRHPDRARRRRRRSVA